MRMRLILFLLFCFTLSFSQDLKPFKTDSLFGYKNENGQVIIKPQFQYATRFTYGYAIVAKNKKLGVINSNNDMLINYKYEFLQALDSLELLYGNRAKYFGEYYMGVISLNDQIKIPNKYKFITKKNNLYIVTTEEIKVMKKNEYGDMRTVENKYGLIDSNGKTILPCKYSYIDWKTPKLLDVSKNNHKNHALFDVNGKRLTNFRFMVFGDFTEGLAKARIKNKYGFVNKKGKIAIPITFDYCEEFKNGYSIITQGEKHGAIDKNGKIVIEPIFDYQTVKSKLLSQ